MNERYRRSLVAEAPAFALEYGLMFRTGPMTMAPSQLGAFTKSDASRATRPNLQYHVQPLTLAEVRRAARSVPGVHRERVQSYARPAAVMSVWSSSPAPDAHAPIIQPNYLSF